MLWAEKIAGNRKKQHIFQSKDEILNKMGRENSQGTIYGMRRICF